MIYGYARCSTNETMQDIGRQVRELESTGAMKIYLECYTLPINTIVVLGWDEQAEKWAFLPKELWESIPADHLC